MRCRGGFREAIARPKVRQVRNISKLPTGEGLGPDNSGFEHENAFYQSAPIARFSKFVSHLDLFRLSAGLPGEIVECGVFKGASLFRWVKFRSLLENAQSRRIVAFDVFGAFPAADLAADAAVRESFVREAGANGLSRAEIVRLLETQNLMENVDLVEGDIRETVPAYVARHPELRISLLHVDVDLYRPTLCCLEAFYPRVVAGGVVVLDDYGAFPGANRAIDEYFAGRPVAIRRLPYSRAISYVVREDRGEASEGERG